MADILKFKRKAISEDKLKQLILYLLHKKGSMTYGELCTLLWQIDAEAYRRFGKSITECRYYRES